MVPHSLFAVACCLLPGNLFLTGPPGPSPGEMPALDQVVIKLGDLGLACLRPEGMMAASAVGTPGFTAPEILRLHHGLQAGSSGSAQQVYGWEVDIFSVGMVMVAMR